ncbi:MAG TPA: DegT/DnrJ/EryC1/StrS family aminotransferase [Candidatus Krumholzibacteria bacterium]|nr:DegT/DnrJ/EryC1/StrS family aminotransferase [Candidatus Krumholzibacteria bacterium]HPD71794.1 DegT/DnrJ/EryC1/StrS family aminotransferase [Candidatus Krumholzibacteria bacterium]HRY41273.1 DegT/DnrJ/EryC1/StrS family aminotransferase [Candidatus Krumholzibacteria bacterium]
MSWRSHQAEQELATWLGRDHAVLTGNGTTALWAVLSALGLPAGASVLYPDLTCATAINAAIFADLRPRFADVRPETAEPTPGDLAAAAAACGAGACVPTRLFGRCGPLGPDLGRCPQIVDAAQGAPDARAAAGGLAAIVSFGPGKQLDLGGGGAIATDDAELARDCRLLLCTIGGDRQRAAAARDELMRELVLLGRESPAGTPAHASRRAALLRRHRSGYLAPPPPELPARLLAGLAGQPERMRRRHARARALADALGPVPGVRLLDLGSRDVPWRVSFAVAADARDPVLLALTALDCAPGRLFAPAHRLAGLPDGDFPMAAALADTLVNLDPDRLGDDAPTAALRAAAATAAALAGPVRKVEHAGT